MILNITLLIVSLGFLYYGAKWLIDGASFIAVSLNISKVVVGIVLVAFGTSAPELFVNVIAGYRGNNGIALSNISGSNLANICLGYGFCALLGKLVINKKQFGIDFIFFCISPLIILFFLLVYPGSCVPVWGAVILGSCFILYLLSAKKRLYEESEQIIKSPNHTFKGSILFLVGVVTLYFSGEMIVKSAVAISEFFKISETIIAISIIAIGTSLPEITATLMAVKKGETAIAAGNILGSNIFNILLVLSGTLIASRKALLANNAIITDYSVVSAMSVVLIITLLVRPKVGKLRAAILISTYFIYMLIRIFFLH